jgi:hypothetical protein
MKKMIFALVAMVMMTMSVNAQSNNNKSEQTFTHMANYLKLRVNQAEPVKKAMTQFVNSMEAYYHLQDVSQAYEAWEKIQTRHKETMKEILSEKQYDKYVKALDLTVMNKEARILDQLTAYK